jgi:hypothetical protein
MRVTVYRGLLRITNPSRECQTRFDSYGPTIIVEPIPSLILAIDRFPIDWRTYAQSIIVTYDNYHYCFRMFADDLEEAKAISYELGHRGLTSFALKHSQKFNDLCQHKRLSVVTLGLSPGEAVTIARLLPSGIFVFNESSLIGRWKGYGEPADKQTRTVLQFAKPNDKVMSDGDMFSVNDTVYYEGVPVTYWYRLPEDRQQVYFKLLGMTPRIVRADTLPIAIFGDSKCIRHRENLLIDKAIELGQLPTLINEHIVIIRRIEQSNPFVELVECLYDHSESYVVVEELEASTICARTILDQTIFTYDSRTFLLDSKTCHEEELRETDSLVRKVCKMKGLEYRQEQADVVGKILRQTKTCIVGGPKTGKLTIALLVAACLELMGKARILVNYHSIDEEVNNIRSRTYRLTRAIVQHCGADSERDLTICYQPRFSSRATFGFRRSERLIVISTASLLVPKKLIKTLSRLNFTKSYLAPTLDSFCSLIKTGQIINMGYTEHAPRLILDSLPPRTCPVYKARPIRNMGVPEFALKSSYSRLMHYLMLWSANPQMQTVYLHTPTMCSVDICQFNAFYGLDATCEQVFDLPRLASTAIQSAMGI